MKLKKYTNIYFLLDIQDRQFSISNIEIFREYVERRIRSAYLYNLPLISAA